MGPIHSKKLCRCKGQSKEPYVSAKEPYMCTQKSPMYSPMGHIHSKKLCRCRSQSKEPYVSAKEPYMSALGMSHMNESCHLWIGHILYRWVMSYTYIDASAKEPYMSAKEPYMSAKEPYMSTKEPYMSAKEPYISVKEPCISAEEPYKSALGMSHTNESCHLWIGHILRPRMEKLHSGRPRTGRLLDCQYGYGTKRPSNETLLTLLVQFY